MAIAMSEQGARAGTASAIMGSMQFACGLLGGILLNFMWWNALFNMALVMAIFVGIAAATIYRLRLPSPKRD
jgi:MFS transporter, DHA1 family, multidrug resistance protein